MSKKLTTEEFIERAKKAHMNNYDYSKVEYINNSTKVCIICPIHGEFWQTPNNHLNGQGCPKCNSKLKLTTEEFIKRARKVHGDKYDYSKVEYKTTKTRVCIICPKHGEFYQTPHVHLRGHGCPYCSGVKKSSTEQFIEKAKKIHGDKYDYSKVEYTNATTKVCIICPIHGEFWQRPNCHLNGQGCPYCCGNVKGSSETFIEKAKKIHGDKYDYSKVEYINNRTKVCIICPKHGEFWQNPHEHLNGCGCLLCGQEISKNSRRLELNEFINRAKQIHGNKYDYSKVKYVNYDTPICIICPKHGEFWQMPHSHLNYHACPKCANENFVQEEKLFELVLDNIKDEVIRQKRFKWLRYKIPMSIDIYLPSKKIGIEYQGKQHFKTVNFFGDNKEQLKRDKEKIKLCKENGIKLLHFTFNKKDCEDWNEYKVYTNINDLIKEINGHN